MDTYRPPNMHHQLCPVCMRPHFPFCPPNPTHAAHHPLREPFYPGESVSHPPYEAFHHHAGQPFARPAHAMPDPGFRGGKAMDFSPHPSYVPQVRPAHFVEDRRDRFSQAPQGHFHSGEAFFPGMPHFSLPSKQYFSADGSATVDFSRQGGQNGWMEAERNFSLQQQRRRAEMGDGIDSSEGFPPKMHVSNLPRADASVNMPDSHFERGFRGDYYQIPNDARFERENSTFFTDSRTGIANGRNHFGPVGYPDSAHTSFTNAGELRENKVLPVHPADFGNYPYITPGSYNNGGLQAPKTFGSGPGQLNALDGPLRTEEGTLEHKLLAHQVSNREDDIRHGCIQFEMNERSEDVQKVKDYALPKKNLKRKNPMSREEELLIEKGLVDDDYSEPHVPEHFSYQAQQGNDHFVRSKQGGLEEKGVPYKQSDHQSSMTSSEQELKGPNLGQVGELNNQSVQSLMSRSVRSKKEEIAGDGSFSIDWPSEDSYARKVPMDGLGNSGKSLSLESLCKGVLHLPSNEPSKTYRRQFEEAQSKEDILYRQYQEWEAEEQHMEAVKKAQRLAREIQGREEVVHTSSSSHPAHFRKSDLLQENKQQAEMFRSGSAETSFEVSILRNAPHQCTVSPKGSSLQHPNYNANIQEPQCRDQQLREGLAQDLKNAQAYAGLHSRQDGSTQISGLSQFWHDNHLINQNISHQDQLRQQPNCPKDDQPAYKMHMGPQYNSMPHFDQQSNSLHPFYPQLGAQEVSQKALDKHAQYSLHYHPKSGAAHDLHRSNPPLPISASVHPPPPDSPPPPPPPSQPPEIATPPPPPPCATFPSAKPFSLQGLSGYSQDYLQQSLPPDGLNYGLPELHRVQQPEISQINTLNPPHFQSPSPQQIEKSKVIDALSVFRNPGRQTRPDRFVVILRGLPGSGKSYFAKALRDVEVMNGGSAPRIHSMDDYFTCEVEKEEEVEMGSSSFRTKKKVVKRVIEYCYEPEMEEAYRASMLKAFRKTLEEGMFKFVIVDDRNVVIADFAQFWAIAKRSGYEVFVLEVPYSDVKGCAARNVHNFTEQQIQSMADRWESTPSLYLRLDVSSLFRADDLNAQDIIEVDMDADDMERDLEEEEEENNQLPEDHLLSSQRIERSTTGDRWEDKNDTAKEAAASSKPEKPSEERGGRHGNSRRNTDNALSGLMTTYGKKDKFVRWSDNQGVKGSSTGFSIGSSQKPASLVIGPGPGYNGTSNRPVEGDDCNREYAELKKSNKFVEQLRAEQEAFKAVFARRRQRIRGMDDEEDD